MNENYDGCDELKITTSINLQGIMARLFIPVQTLFYRIHVQGYPDRMSLLGP